MRQILISITIIGFTLFLVSCRASRSNYGIDVQDYVFLTLKDTIKIEVVQSFKNDALCGKVVVYGIIVGKILEKACLIDTITILSPCDLRKFLPGEIYNISPNYYSNKSKDLTYRVLSETKILNGIRLSWYFGAKYPAVIGTPIEDKK